MPPEYAERRDTMNKALFIGNLTRDPETKMMTNGKARTMFTIAVNRPYTDQNGQRSADFITCIAYDKTAELIGKYLAKGRKCAVEAHVRTGKYEKDGQTIWTTEFVTDKIEFLSSVQESSAGSNSPASTSAPPADNGDFTEVQDDELPF